MLTIKDAGMSEAKPSSQRPVNSEKHKEARRAETGGALSFCFFFLCASKEKEGTNKI